ncbi:MAG TPA: sugar ABC transporter permease [Terriglobales bacterium]|nr:sugar ABC transporter permease [Terriglobales bacterium]
MADAATLSALPISSATKRRSNIKVWRRAAILLAPSLILLALFTYWPIVQVLYQSLSVASFGGQAHLGLDNFHRLFADPHFGKAVWNNVIYGVFTIFPSIVLSLLFAVGLKESTRFSALLRTCFVFPTLIPLVAAAALFTFIFLPRFGLIDYQLGRFGLSAVNWLGDPDLALFSVILITIWKNAGYYMLFFLAGLQGIPEDLHEAARVEGATTFQRFRRITLPLLRPTMTFVFVIALLQVLTTVDHIILMTSGGPNDATNLILFYIYEQAAQNYDTGLAAAATVISLAGLLVLSLISLRTLEHGIHYEG